MSLSRHIGLTFLIQLLAFTAGAANHVLLSRWLGPAQLGLFALFLATVDGLKKSVPLGQESSLLYFVSNRRYDDRALLSTIAWSGVILFVGAAAVGALLVESGVLADLFGGTLGMAGPMASAILTAMLLAAMVHEWGGNLWLGRQRFPRYNAGVLIPPLLLGAFLVTALLLGRLTLATALGLYALSWLLPGLWWWWRAGNPFRAVWDRAVAGDALRYGVPSMSNRALDFLIKRADLFIVSMLIGDAASGWYAVAVMVGERLHYLANATWIVLLPAAARTPERHGQVPLIARGNLLVVMVGAILAALLAGPVVPFLFGEAFRPAVEALLALLPGMIAQTLPRVLAADFGARGRPGFNAVVSLVNLAVMVPGSVLLIPEMGIVGAGIAVSVAGVVSAVVALGLYRRLSGEPLSRVLLPRRGDWRALREM